VLFVLISTLQVGFVGVLFELHISFIVDLGLATAYCVGRIGSNDTIA
jgi:hypothetical protein